MSNGCDQKQRRAQALSAILESRALLKLVVAGAGTGKTYAFESLLRARGATREGALALTFINNLVQDMSEKLGNLAESRTFHSYCRKLLHKKPFLGLKADFTFFPKLKNIIAEDAELLGFADGINGKEFDCAIRMVDDSKGLVSFFIDCANFYNAVGFDDCVYRMLRCFEKNPDALPMLKQLVVDEFQDFCDLEVKFLDLLIQKSPTLIAGDDDQALYEFRQASPRHIRGRWSSGMGERFTLPFCSRCPEVIVKATNEVISVAERAGFLSGRIQKPYECFLPDKQDDNKKYPRIKIVACSVQQPRAPYVAKYIWSEIQNISREEIGQSAGLYPAVLIIGPSHYLREINKFMKGKTTELDVDYSEHPPDDVDVAEGYRLLLRDEKSNLGWRIVFGHLAGKDAVRLALESARKKGGYLFEEISDDDRRTIRARCELLKKLADPEIQLSTEDVRVIEECFGLPLEVLRGQMAISEGVGDDDDDGGMEDAPPKKGENKKPIIKLTTYSGAKGLSGGHVFVVGFEDGAFPKTNRKPTDTEICQFIVAMTRTRHECSLIWARRIMNGWRKPSVFLNWIPDDLKLGVVVDKNYFKT